MRIKIIINGQPYADLTIDSDSEQSAQRMVENLADEAKRRGKKFEVIYH